MANSFILQFEITDSVGALFQNQSHHVRCSKCNALMWMPGATRPEAGGATATMVDGWAQEFAATSLGGNQAPALAEACAKATKLSRSTLVRLRNRASSVLTLVDGSCHVESGIWVVEPPRESE